jgi:mannonate dehydratase
MERKCQAFPGAPAAPQVFVRMAYLLERIVPVAERCKVQLCCHLSDPPAPVLRGVERWDYPVREGIDRFLALYDSPYHGMTLCCGTLKSFY